MNEITRDDLYIAAAERVAIGYPVVLECRPELTRHDYFLMELRQVVNELMRDFYGNQTHDWNDDEGCLLNWRQRSGGVRRYDMRQITHSNLSLNDKINLRGYRAIPGGRDGSIFSSANA